MEFLRKNFILVIAFLLPVMIVIGITIVAYFPLNTVSTGYNFIYATCGTGSNRYGYGCEQYLNMLYTVENGKLVVKKIGPDNDFNRNGIKDADENFVTRLFLHDTDSNESREITLAEAESMKLDKLITSPDGVSVSDSYDRNPNVFFLFGGSSNYGYYLTKGGKKSRLNLINNDDRYYYRGNFKFIGWVATPR